MNPKLTQLVRPSDDVLFQEVGSEVVLLNLANETYFGLDEVGARVWSYLHQEERLDGVVVRMMEEFDVDRDRVEKDVLGLVEKLVEAGLVSLE